MSKKVSKLHKATPEKIKYLSELRIIQTNLVYLCGIPKKYANKDVFFFEKKNRKTPFFNIFTIFPKRSSQNSNIWANTVKLSRS